MLRYRLKPVEEKIQRASPQADEGLNTVDLIYVYNKNTVNYRRLFRPIIFLFSYILSFILLDPQLITNI